MAAGTPFDRVEAFKVTVAAGVAQAAPAATDISFNPGEVVGIEIDIPDGHSGLTGLQIASAHQPIIPFTAGAFLIGNDDKIEWTMQGLPDTGNWQALCFNTDRFPHSFYIRFLVVELQRYAATYEPAALPPLQLATG
jgi:hypothetical protein